MNKQDLTKMLAKIEKENSIFANKAYLDILAVPDKIIGRQKEAEDLVRCLAGYKQGYVVPFVSVYGRSGSGKSTVVRFVCKHLTEISHCIVNLRKAKTIFGATNLILAELGQENLKSPQGINVAIEKIGATIESILKKEKRNLFALVLDESDVLFFDKRDRPSDFIYKLLILEESLRTKGFFLCVISVSNNPFSDYELDDRVRSRIGSSEVFFSPYFKEDVKKILEERAEKAFSKKLDEGIIEYCAQLSSEDHGDARRAIDLLRVAAELASSKEEKISKNHVDQASEKLQKDRVSSFLSSASYQFKLICTSLARVSYLTGKEWHSTSSIYSQYRKIVHKDTRPVTYRRASELLTELENTGLAVSQTSSKGRYGYGTQYKLVVSPDTVGLICFPEFWKSLVTKKIEYDVVQEQKKYRPVSSLPGLRNLARTLDHNYQNSWKKFVGEN